MPETTLIIFIFLGTLGLGHLAAEVLQALGKHLYEVHDEGKGELSKYEQKSKFQYYFAVDFFIGLLLIIFISFSLFGLLQIIF